MSEKKIGDWYTCNAAPVDDGPGGKGLRSFQVTTQALAFEASADCAARARVHRETVDFAKQKMVGQDNQRAAISVNAEAAAERDREAEAWRLLGYYGAWRS